MIAASEHDYHTDILDILAKRVVVGDGAMSIRLQAADPSVDDFDNRRRRGRDEICSAAIWLGLGSSTLPTRPTSRRSRAPRSPSRVELGVHTSGDDVDFSGREALQRFRVPTGIRHARQSQGRLPLRKEPV